jgi:hypothetical protein
MLVVGLVGAAGGCKKAERARAAAPVSARPAVDPAQPLAGATPLQAPDAGRPVAAIAPDASVRIGDLAGGFGGIQFKTVLGKGKFGRIDRDVDLPADLQDLGGLGLTGAGVGGGGRDPIPPGEVGVMGHGSGTLGGFGNGSGRVHRPPSPPPATP